MKHGCYSGIDLVDVAAGLGRCLHDCLKGDGGHFLPWHAQISNLGVLVHCCPSCYCASRCWVSGIAQAFPSPSGVMTDYLLGPYRLKHGRAVYAFSQSSRLMVLLTPVNRPSVGLFKKTQAPCHRACVLPLSRMATASRGGVACLQATANRFALDDAWLNCFLTPRTRQLWVSWVLAVLPFCWHG